MGSHRVTCHPTQVNTSHLNSSQMDRYLIYLSLRDGQAKLSKMIGTSIVNTLAVFSEYLQLNIQFCCT